MPTNTRQLIVNGLVAANVSNGSDNPILLDFISASSNPKLELLELDSLGLMELCIHIEINAGVSILPENILSLETLEQLAAFIEQQQ